MGNHVIEGGANVAPSMSMKHLTLATLFAFVCCTPAPEGSRDVSTPPATSSTATTAGETQPPAPEAKVEDAATRREITIDSVAGGNPLEVRGHARTFENAVSLRVRDAQGRLVTEEHTTSAGETGRHNPYEAKIWIVRDPGPRVTVEAFEYSAKDGSVRSLTAKTVPYAVASIPATLFFPAGDCTRIQAFPARVPRSQGMARLLVEALLAGPDPAAAAAGATAPFPKGSDVNSVILRNGVVTVDFNERLQNVGGACAATAIRESVTRTLKALPTVKSVVLTAGGREDLALQP
jgi:hypothetical protein